MKLAIIGTGMIVGCALECLEQIPSIERKAIYARPHSKDKAQDTPPTSSQRTASCHTSRNR